MTARRGYVLCCDALACAAVFHGSSLSAAAVRAEARREQWTAKKARRTVHAVNGVREIIYLEDLCPVHRGHL